MGFHVHGFAVEILMGFGYTPPIAAGKLEAPVH